MVFKVRLFPKNCSCGYPLGLHQKRYEDEVLKIYSQSKPLEKDSLRRAQNQALNNLGWFRMCCRNCCWNGPSPIIIDSSFGAYRNEVGTPSDLGVTNSEDFILKNRPEVVPRRNVPLFHDLPANVGSEDVPYIIPEEKNDTPATAINRNIFNIISSNSIVYLPQRKNKIKVYK